LLPDHCAVEDEGTRIQHSNLRSEAEIVSPSAYDVNDKGIPDAAWCAIEFQYAEVVKQ